MEKRGRCVFIYYSVTINFVCRNEMQLNNQIMHGNYYNNTGYGHADRGNNKFNNRGRGGQRNGRGGHARGGFNKNQNQPNQ